MNSLTRLKIFTVKIFIFEGNLLLKVN